MVAPLPTGGEAQLLGIVVPKGSRLEALHRNRLMQWLDDGAETRGLL